MRDVHKLKEKFELSLDTRQILTLSFVGIIALGGVFVLGVAVGRKLASDDKVGDQPDLLAELDTKLTYQEELTRPAPRVPKAPPVPPPAPVAEAAEPPKPLEAPKAPEVVAEALEAAEAPKPVAESPRPHEQVVTRTAAPAPRDAGDLQAAIARAQRPAEVSADGNWTLQLSAYQDRAEADRFAAELRGKGYAPYVIEAHVAGKGTWYRVRMGRFPSKDAAGRYLTDFHRETQLQAIVTTVN